MGQEAQPATDRRTRKAAGAVADNGAQGFGSALTPPIKVSSQPLQAVGFPFALVGSGDLLALPLRPGFEVRPFPSAGKIERPTAVRTVFERPGG
jgi:hypothetical protein